VKVRLEEILHKGRGVVATTAIEIGDLIECCPVILFRLDSLNLQNSGLGPYYFEWEDDCGAIVLGLGTLYNHSYQPNAQFIRDYPRRLMNFVAVRPITPGEEITINYNYYPGDLTPVDFEVF